VPGLRNGGSRVSLEFTIALLRDGHGQLAGLVAVLRDVTERFEEVRALRRKLADSSGPLG
jgi:PAS domain S-box-containing protein